MPQSNELLALQYLNAYAAARSTVGANDDDEAENAFLDVIHSVAQPKRNELNALYAQLKSPSQGDIFIAYAEAAKQFGALKKEFELGEIKASNAQSSLFFPAMAKELKTLAESLSSLKKATDSLLEDVDEAKSALKSQDVKALFDEANSAKASLESVIDALNLLKS